MVAPLLAALLVAQAPAPFPRAASTPVCGARTIPYQQAALAPSTGGGVWLACRNSRSLVRLASSGERSKTVRLGTFRPWAVAAGGGALWVISRDVPQLLKLGESGTPVERIGLAGVPASLWFGAGSVWVGLESFGFQRIDPRTGRTTTFTDGDGVSAFASDGADVYAVSHRDNAITRVDVSTGRSRRLAVRLVDPATGAMEAAAFLKGSLWITGRGLDLLRVDPATGKVRAVTDVGAAAFDVVADSGRIVVASYSKRGARRGDPIVGSFSSVDARSGRVTASIRATGTAYLSGLVVSGSTMYAADTVQGRLLRLPRPK